MRVLEIKEEKVDKLSKMCEKLLRLSGKMMTCLEEMNNVSYSEEEDDDDMDMRSRYGRMSKRGRYY